MLPEVIPFFDVPDELPDQEVFEVLMEGRKEGGFRLERILSCGQVSPDGFWYDQECDEWVLLIQGRARLAFEDGELVLGPGDSLLIPAGCRHRVTFTSASPPCLWLALHGDSFG